MNGRYKLMRSVPSFKHNGRKVISNLISQSFLRKLFNLIFCIDITSMKLDSAFMVTHATSNTILLAFFVKQ